MKFLAFLVAISLLVGCSVGASERSSLDGGTGEDLINAPPGFSWKEKPAVFVDFQFADLTLRFDVPNKTAVGHARIEFFARTSGYPLLDLVPNPTAVSLNGKSLGAEAMLTVTTPGEATTLRMIDAPVAELSTNVLEIDYPIAEKDLTFANDGVRFGFFMSDVGADRDFLERYAPANLEYDRFQLRLHLSVKGGGKHRIFTNGEAKDAGENEWTVLFPAYFTSSSFYLHLTERNMYSTQIDYVGLAATIPIIAYSDSSSTADEALKQAQVIMKELEADYGPFAHPRMVIYANQESGGMEYCGATTTSMSALGHEMLHSWFARGVMPSNGNAGWIDEAIATWRDNEYPVASAAPNREPVNLAGFSPYRRTTPSEAYEMGGKLMSELDFLMKSKAGLKPILRNLFAVRQHTTITTPQLIEFLKGQTALDVGEIFDRYVYGKGSVQTRARTPGLRSLHPRAYTQEELERLR